MRRQGLTSAERRHRRSRQGYRGHVLRESRPSLIILDMKEANGQAFIAALTKYPKQSYQQLLVTVREEMKGRYSQKPQLSACHRQ